MTPWFRSGLHSYLVKEGLALLPLFVGISSPGILTGLTHSPILIVSPGGSSVKRMSGQSRTLWPLRKARVLT